MVTSEWPGSGCVVERATFFRHGGTLGCRPVAVGVCDALHMWSFRSLCCIVILLYVKRTNWLAL